MYVDIANTDNSDSALAPQPGPPPADPTAGLKPKRPPAPSLEASRRCPKPDGRDRSLGESGDAYAGSLFDVPGTSWRVVVCAQGRQWIAQQREGKDHWVSRKFFANKRRLAAVLKTLVPDRAFQAVKDKIEALPI